MKVFIEDVTAIVEGVEEVKGKMYIESDSMNFMINLHTGTRTDDKGKVTDLYTNKGYYGTLAQAVKALVTMKLKESTATTLHELIKDVARIEQYVEDKINF